MKKNIYLVLAILLLASCDTSKDPVRSVKNEIQVKVYNTKTWNSVNDKMDTVVGADVYLINDSANYTWITVVPTDNNGIATFSNVKEKNYYIKSWKDDDLCNLVNRRYSIDGNMFGNLIIGVYKSKEDINSSAANPNAIIGGYKLSDVNNDGRIDSVDMVRGVTLDYKMKYKDINGDGIIDAKDLENGALVKLDNVVKVSIFIGK